ncbi:MAG: galactokinase [Solirubrobacterales bacterium]|nr:galactokinase [Solirubrobacterales bacterium]
MPQAITAFAPGRVNLIGEHTDYNQGLALPFAISGGVTVRAQPGPPGRVEVIAADLGASDSFSLHDPEPAEGWRAFARGAVAELRRQGARLAPAQLEVSGTVPRGSGLSSSAALEVALCMALLELGGEPAMDPLELARLCSRIENEWVGARTGLLDQIASLFGRRDSALRIDFRSLEVTPVALALERHKLVTLDSGEQHAHAGGGYNERREECARACRQLEIPSLRDATPEMIDALEQPLAARARHVITENERVERTIAALEAGDLEEVGRLLDASHASLRDCYEISTPAVEAAVDRLRAAGALGARIMGGGFGGNVLGLLPPDAEAPSGAIEVRPGAGARLLADSRR